MSKFDKLLIRLISGSFDKNFDFSDLTKILVTLEFLERIKGSHHIFFKEGISEIINISHWAARPSLIKLNK